MKKQQNEKSFTELNKENSSLRKSPEETKEKRIEQLAAALDPILETQASNLWELDANDIAAQLVGAGFGNLREFKQEIISRYLKGDIAGLLTLLQEEI